MSPERAYQARRRTAASSVGCVTPQRHHNDVAQVSRAWRAGVVGGSWCRHHGQRNHFDWTGSLCQSFSGLLLFRSLRAKPKCLRTQVVIEPILNPLVTKTFGTKEDLEGDHRTSPAPRHPTRAGPDHPCPPDCCLGGHVNFLVVTQGGFGPNGASECLRGHGVGGTSDLVCPRLPDLVRGL